MQNNNGLAMGQLKKLVKKSLLSSANKKIDTFRSEYENKIIDEETYRNFTEPIRLLIYELS